jgi:DHA1 family tetracycline resistance protein-like MFS transporter
VFVDLLGLTLVLPALPFHTAALGGSGLALGVVVAAFSAAQALAAPLLGRLADRCGRRRVLLLSLAGSTASLVLMALVPTLWALVLARLVAGACGGSIGVAHAMVADLTAPQRRTAAMGRLGMAVGAAFTVGPLLGAFSATAGFATVALAGAALAAVAWLLAWRLPVAPPPEPGCAARRAGSAEGAPWALVAAAFAGMCALVGMETTVAFLAERRFAAGPGFVGALLCVAGLAMTLVQARPLTAGVRRWGERRVAVTSGLAMAAGLAAMPVTGAPGLVAAVVVVAAGQGLLSTTTTSLLSQSVDPDRRGELLGRAQSAAATARLVGPVGAGALYDLGVGLPFIAAAALAVVAAAAVGSSARSAVLVGGTR